MNNKQLIKLMLIISIFERNKSDYETSQINTKTNKHKGTLIHM